MRKIFLLVLIAVCFALQGFSQSKDSTTLTKMLSYFKEHHGAACIKTYADFRKFGTDFVGSPKGLFVTTEDDMETIIQKAQEYGGGRKYWVPYIASMLGTDWKEDDTLVRYYIPASNLDSLKIRLPDSASFGANDKFIPGGRTISGMNEAYLKQIPKALLGVIPNYYGANDTFEILYPATKIPVCNDMKYCTSRSFSGNELVKPTMTAIGWLFVFSPLILFIFIFLWFANKIMYGRYSLQDALSETQDSKIVIPNPQYDSERIKTVLEQLRGTNPNNSPSDLINISTVFPPTIEISDTGTDRNKHAQLSSSRIIVFLSSIILLLFVISMCCLFLYCALMDRKFPDLSSLTNILIELGIGGILPYGISKITKTITNNNKNNNK